MDILKYINLAAKLGLPGIVSDVIGGLTTVRAAAAKAKHTVTDADLAELEQIHQAALAANAELDAKLAAAELR